MDNQRKKQLLQILAESHEKVTNGEEISTEYARILFPPSRKEYELTYAGKDSEQQIISQTFAAPIQPDRQFGNPDESGWLNKIIFGDNLQVLKSLTEMKKRGELKNEDGTDGVRLVYIDPPFATKQDFSKKDTKAYTDKLKGAEFMEWLRKRIIMLKEVMSDDGSIFVHLDWHKAHYVKVLLDEIFGEGNFVNEIVWAYKDVGGGRNNNFYKRKHDTIFWYSKTSNYQTNEIARDVLSKSTLDRFASLFDENGIITYRSFQEKRPTEFNTRVSQGRVPEDLDSIFLDKANGRQLEDVWSDINPIRKRGKSKNKNEKFSYPTQKPEQLLERIIKTVTKEGDIVLDCFGGSGTTASVSEKLNRRWITGDIGKLSIYTIQKRILNIENHKSFSIYNAGLYDEEKLNNFDSEQWKLFAMALYDVEPLSTVVKGFKFDGIKDGFPVKVYSPDELMSSQILESTLEDIYTRLGTSADSEIFIIAPQGKFGFAVDEYNGDNEDWNTLFNILRVPFSMSQKFTEGFTAAVQANDSDSVNKAIDAFGFDFIRPPKVEFELDDSKLIINNFESYSRVKGENKVSGIDSFAMLLIDQDYNGEFFEIDKVFYRDDFDKENQLSNFGRKDLGGQTMFIFIDKFGNEFKTIRGELS